jgi:hypothetical protein
MENKFNNTNYSEKNVVIVCGTVYLMTSAKLEIGVIEPWFNKINFLVIFYLKLLFA